MKVWQKTIEPAIPQILQIKSPVIMQANSTSRKVGVRFVEFGFLKADGRLSSPLGAAAARNFESQITRSQITPPIRVAPERNVSAVLSPDVILLQLAYRPYIWLQRVVRYH